MTIDVLECATRAGSGANPVLPCIAWLRVRLTCSSADEMVIRPRGLNVCILFIMRAWQPRMAGCVPPFEEENMYWASASFSQIMLQLQFSPPPPS